MSATFIAASVAVASFVAFQPQAHAGVVINVSFDLRGGATNPCTGEFVLFEGKAHFLLRLTTDQGGGFHSGSHFNGQGLVGLGELNGNRYVVASGSRNSFNLKQNAADNFTATSQLLMVRPGSEDNFLTHSTIHFTVNAQGEPTSSVSQFRIECQG